MAALDEDRTDALRWLPRPLSENDTCLLWTLKSLLPCLRDPEFNALCIYRPGEAFVERGHHWTRVPMPFANFQWCLHLARLVGIATRQRIAEDSPLLSASLPSGERLQFAIPPATLPKHVSIVIGRPSLVAVVGSEGVFAYPSETDTARGEGRAERRCGRFCLAEEN